MGKNKKKNRYKNKKKYNHKEMIKSHNFSIFGKIGRIGRIFEKPIDPEKHPLGKEAYLKLLDDVDKNIIVVHHNNFFKGSKKDKSRIISY